ncbi:MAG: glycosyltransferase family 39 protein [Nitrososphaerota archaeon]|nr:glycosyltransferase family 39 protein [Nitrososphaerota archaeon]
MNTEKAPLGATLNKWRLLFLCFALAYAIILLLNIVKAPIQWDEISHLNGGALIYWGHYDNFVSRAFYPPLFDAFTFVAFKVLGISLFTARLFPVFFSILSLWAVFELATYMYGGKAGLLSAVMLGIMPGFFWLSGYAMIETTLMFFITASLLCFYHWLVRRQDRMLVISGLALGLGFLAKYQMIIASVIMLLSLILLARKHLKVVLKKFSIVIATAVLVVTPWLVIAYEVYKNIILNQWLYALQVGNPERSIYSTRFPGPIFYFIELVWPYNDIHPVSIFLYISGLAGLAFMAWRHRHEDKFILIWFTTIFVFFTLISNKEWRYVTPLFPALAISTSVAILALGNTIQKAWKKPSSAKKKRLIKAASAMLAVMVAGAMLYSIYDAHSYTSQMHITIDLKGATNYALTHMEANKSFMLLCPFNLFSADMVEFYLLEKGEHNIKTYQYPDLPVDTYTPNFSVTELIKQCKQYNVQYIFTYELGGTVPYYNTTLNLQQIYEQLYASGNFTHITDEQTFGTNPRRIFLLNFTG